MGIGRGRKDRLCAEGYSKGDLATLQCKCSSPAEPQEATQSARLEGYPESLGGQRGAGFHGRERTFGGPARSGRRRKAKKQAGPAHRSEPARVLRPIGQGDTQGFYHRSSARPTTPSNVRSFERPRKLLLCTASIHSAVLTVLYQALTM